jgi:hypothetical protein
MIDNLPVECNCKFCNRKIYSLSPEYVHLTHILGNQAYFVEKHIQTGSKTTEIGRFGAGRMYQTSYSYMADKVPLCLNCYNRYQKGMYLRRILTLITLLLIPVTSLILYLYGIIPHFPFFVFIPLLILYLCCLFFLKPLISAFYGCILYCFGMKTFL